ncbi:hypothetical protein [Halocatena pleomorpha]|uniref:Glycosyltransferase RgtA/B/C/D-like domain-containing protein n=1 Tax=Halocatena pleomorpha TaxID=1785090 RepID=A0A3P3RJD7_9EURY|nr:hypothetical protein [Halocatena pleomorpha]RRJ33647.1 hypothetical protein EIK79_02285 [Halocatena pleomorpha]
MTASTARGAGTPERQTGTNPERWWTKPLVTIGFLSLTGAILSAKSVPAVGYELSLYAATPVQFWVGVGVALGGALLVAFVSPVRWVRSLALVLAATAVLSVLGLPFIRGYYFYGTADPMTHLGLAKDLDSGRTSPLGIIYPGIHMVAVFINRIVGYSLRRAVLLVTPLFVLVYILFVPLCVRLLVSGPRATTIGVFSALLLLPINHISTHFRVHPFTLTTLYSAFIVFLLLKAFLSGGRYDRRSKQSEPVDTVAGTFVVLAVVLASVVLYHPQQALNVLLLFVTICGVQLLYRLFRSDHPVSKHPRLYAPTLFFFGVYALWTTRTSWFYRLADKHLGKIAGYIRGDTIAGKQIQAQGDSITAIGASLPELFVKLFLLSAVYTAITAVIALLSVSHAFDDDATVPESTRLYLSLSLLPLFGVFLVYFVGSISKMQFRHLGFLMLLATLLGAVGLCIGLDRLSRSVSLPRGGLLFAAVFALMLVLAIAPAYQSPYIYKQNVQVTEMQMEGYNQTFEHRADGVPVLGIRMEPTRYADATRGVQWRLEREKLYRKTVPFNTISRLQATFESPRYVIVTRLDREREINAYQQLRFSKEGFRSIEHQPGVDRVMSNGEVQLYYVANRSESTSGGPAATVGVNR